MNASISTIRLLGALCAVVFFTAVSAAENYPTKAIKLVVGRSAGGAADAQARVFAKVAGAELGQKVFVDNMPGASGTIAAETVAKSPPDGYTLFFGINSELALAPAIGQKVAYDPHSSFTPVTGLSSLYYALFVTPSLGVKTLAEFIALAKAKPGTISFGSSGNASMQHFLGDLFCKKVGVDLNHVAYKGDAPAITDMLGGHIQALFAVPVAILTHVKAGKLIPIVVAAPKRFVSLPDVPTAKESGIEGLDIAVWTGILAPAGTPRYIIDKLNTAFVKARNSPEAMKLPGAADFGNLAGTPEAFAAFMKAERERWVKLVKASGIKLE